jgi:hypothetical protein
VKGLAIVLLRAPLKGGARQHARSKRPTEPNKRAGTVLDKQHRGPRCVSHAGPTRCVPFLRASSRPSRQESLYSSRFRRTSAVLRAFRALGAQNRSIEASSAGRNALFLGAKIRARAVPTRVGTLKGAGWGRESHRRDGELGRRLVRGRRGGSIFRPLSTPGEGVDPSIQAIGAGVKDPLFWGRRLVLLQYQPPTPAHEGGRLPPRSYTRAPVHLSAFVRSLVGVGHLRGAAGSRKRSDSQTTSASKRTGCGADRV